jgi:hypothetical protein
VHNVKSELAELAQYTTLSDPIRQLKLTDSVTERNVISGIALSPHVCGSIDYWLDYSFRHNRRVAICY